MAQPPPSVPFAGERIAKAIARAGICSRRDAERLIEEGRVTLNGVVLRSPAINVTEKDEIRIDGKRLRAPEPARLWRYHKPVGLVTTHRDPAGRPTVFEALPKELGRVISIGRLDLTSEGLLLLTNDGALARAMELPANALPRRYRARAYGRVSPQQLESLSAGATIDGVRYGPIHAELERQQGANAWITLELREGKNREVRRVLESLGLQVNRLIRTAYGPFELGLLAAGDIDEAPRAAVRALQKRLDAVKHARP